MGFAENSGPCSEQAIKSIEKYGVATGSTRHELGTQKYMIELQNQQEILLNAADIIIDAYQMESAVLRAQKLAANGNAENQIDMASVFCNDAIQRIEMKARNTIAALAEGDEMRTLLVALKRFTKNNSPINTIGARQRIADTLIQANTYTL